MALIKCKECGAQISSTASTCPQCGAKPPAKTSVLTLIVGGFFVTVVGSCVYNIAGQADRDAKRAAAEAAKSPEEKAKDKKAAAESAAVYSCMQTIKLNLKDPDSADFDGWSRSWREWKKDGNIQTQIRVRAKNSFGAYTVSIFECTAKPDGPDRWIAIPRSIKDINSR